MQFFEGRGIRAFVLSRERKLNTNFVFLSNFSGPPGHPAKSPGYPVKKICFPSFKGHTELFLAPTPSRGRPLPKRKISGLRSLGWGSFFVPDFQETSIPPGCFSAVAFEMTSMFSVIIQGPFRGRNKPL